MLAETRRAMGEHVLRLWPEISPEMFSALVEMLANFRVTSVSPQALYEAFDSLFDRLFAGDCDTLTTGRLRDRLKAYYLPQLTWADGLIELSHLVSSQPGILSDSKLYKNAAKRLISGFSALKKVSA